MLSGEVNRPSEGSGPHPPPPNATRVFLLLKSQIPVAFGGGAEGGGGFKTCGQSSAGTKSQRRADAHYHLILWGDFSWI